MDQNLNISKCNATGKTRYATPGDAKKALHKLKAKVQAYDNVTQKRVKRRSGKPAQCRFYRCPLCKGFHLTSSEAALNSKSIQKKFFDKIKSNTSLILTSEQAKDWKAGSLPFPEQENPNP
jgi:iron only hydrogenase large subunit-like protein